MLYNKIQNKIKKINFNLKLQKYKKITKPEVLDS